MRLETNLPGISVETIEQVEQQVGHASRTAYVTHWVMGTSSNLGIGSFIRSRTSGFSIRHGMTSFEPTN